MRYLIANFKKEIPTIAGMQRVNAFMVYSLFELTDDAWSQFPFDSVSWEEVSELEGTEGWKFYSEVRGYRSVYPDVEGEDKIKVEITPEIEESTITLMKRVFKKMIQDEFDGRESREGEDALLSEVDGLTSIAELNVKREDYLGIQMPIPQAKEMGLLDENGLRNPPVDYNLGF
jgi:hypothetical protein